MNCTHEFFFDKNISFEEKCHLASCIDSNSCCSVNYNFVNFFQIAWCWFNGDWYVLGCMMAAAVVVFLLALRFIWNLVEEFLSPACLYLTMHFKLSEPFGRVTLLGLGNCTLFTSLIS